MKPSRQAKYRQVEEFLRILDASITEAMDKGHLRRPTADEPLRMADLGCGNGYLTFAAQRYLTHVRELPVTVIGVDVKPAVDRPQHRVGDRARHGRGVRGERHRGRRARPRPGPGAGAARLRHRDRRRVCSGGRLGVAARAGGACCHHDIAAQLRTSPSPGPYR